MTAVRQYVELTLVWPDNAPASPCADLLAQSFKNSHVYRFYTYAGIDRTLKSTVEMYESKPARVYLSIETVFEGDTVATQTEQYKSVWPVPEGFFERTAARALAITGRSASGEIAEPDVQSIPDEPPADRHTPVPEEIASHADPDSWITEKGP